MINLYLWIGDRFINASKLLTKIAIKFVDMANKEVEKKEKKNGRID